MKIKHLIEVLKQYNPDAEITTPYSEDIHLSYITYDDSTNEELDMKSTKLVFIEGRDLCPICSHEYIENDIRMCSFYKKPCELVGECYQFEEFYEYV